MRDRIHTAGTGVRDLLSIVPELVDGIRSIDRKRIPDPKKAIQALRSTASTVRKAGSDELKKLRKATQDLQDAIDAMKVKVEIQVPEVHLAEWWWNLKNVFDRLKKAVPSIRDIPLPNPDDLSLDKIAEVIAKLGVTGLVLVMLMAYVPSGVAAARAASFAALGPFGIGGIAVVGILLFISRAIAKFGIDKVLPALLIKLKEGGRTSEDIREEINAYPIPDELKQKIEELIEEFYEG